MKYLRTTKIKLKFCFNFTLEFIIMCPTTKDSNHIFPIISHSELKPWNALKVCSIKKKEVG